MSSDDLSGDLPTFVKAGVDAETSVSLARRPEVNVFMAELFLEKLLKKMRDSKFEKVGSLGTTYVCVNPSLASSY